MGYFTSYSQVPNLSYFFYSSSNEVKKLEYRRMFFKDSDAPELDELEEALLRQGTIISCIINGVCKARNINMMDYLEEDELVDDIMAALQGVEYGSIVETVPQVVDGLKEDTKKFKDDITKYTEDHFGGDKW